MTIVTVDTIILQDQFDSLRNKIKISYILY